MNWKKFIRLNANYIILFKLSKRNLNDVYNSIVDNIIEKNDFKILAENTWSEKYKYIVIDKDKNKILEDVFD